MQSLPQERAAWNQMWWNRIGIQLYDRDILPAIGFTSAIQSTIDCADQSASAFDRYQSRGGSVIQFDRAGRECCSMDINCANLWLMSLLFLLLSPCQPINNVFISKEPIQSGYVSGGWSCNNGQLHRSMHRVWTCKKIVWKRWRDTWTG